MKKKIFLFLALAFINISSCFAQVDGAEKALQETLDVLNQNRVNIGGEIVKSVVIVGLVIVAAFLIYTEQKKAALSPKKKEDEKEKVEMTKAELEVMKAKRHIAKTILRLRREGVKHEK